MQIHGIGTIAAIFMPALLPGCATLYEVGAYVKDGDVIPKLLVDSPDGFIKIDHNPSSRNCCEPDIFHIRGDNIALELKSPYPQPEKIPVHYSVPRWYVLQILIHMHVTDSEYAWYGCCGTKSVVLIECTFNEDLWNKIWSEIKKFLDKRKPVATHWPKHIVSEMRDDLDSYVQNCTELIGEVPIVTTDVNEAELRRPFRFTPYHKSVANRYRSRPSLLDVKDMIHLLYVKALKLLKEAYHIVREEAAEIIAFVAADSTRVPEPGHPKHIPIAYGLKGHSLPMTLMRHLINDVRDACKATNVQIRCEAYDGQFLNLVHYSADGSPLTRLSFIQEYYKEVKKWSKMQCINHLVTVAIPHEIHIDYHTTPKVLQLWQKSIDDLAKRQENRPPRPPNPTLGQDDITNLFRGSQLGSRLTRQVQADYSDDDSDDDNYGDEQDDPDYVANDSDLELNYNSDYSDDLSKDLNEELDDLIADNLDQVSVSSEVTFLEDVLQSLRDLKRGKIDWSEMDVNDLVNKFLKDPTECMKMVVDELNLIGNLIQTYTGIKVFNVSDNKSIKINKLMTNLQTSSQELITTSRRRGRQSKVKTLKQLARAPVMEAIYSKDYLQIVVANTMFTDGVNQWLNRTSIPMVIKVDQDDGDYFDHTCNSFPEYNENREQHEYRCIDPGHTLANMRSQISRYGYDFCSKAAFVRVSDRNHKVLPKSILEDRLDRQSIRIAKRFFSSDVEDELRKNSDYAEAKFVRLVRNWFEACDERGIDVYTRVRHLQDFFDFLTALVDWEEMPPPFSYIKGMPIPTYESIMQGISTRLQIFALSNMPINQRSISTVGIESFFSELTSMEFSGLGCPKAVDIPRLISHVTELNSIRHDPNR